MQQYGKGRGIRRITQHAKPWDTAAAVESDRKHAEAMKAEAKRRKQNAESHKRKLG